MISANRSHCGCSAGVIRNCACNWRIRSSTSCSAVPGAALEDVGGAAADGDGGEVQGGPSAAKNPRSQNDAFRAINGNLCLWGQLNSTEDQFPSNREFSDFCPLSPPIAAKKFPISIPCKQIPVACVDGNSRRQTGNCFDQNREIRRRSRYPFFSSVGRLVFNLNMQLKDLPAGAKGRVSEDYKMLSWRDRGGAACDDPHYQPLREGFFSKC